jgi:hypothetical protein
MPQTTTAPFAEEHHFALLCWELHNLADGPHKQTELVAIRRRLGAPENETMKRITALDNEPLRREVVVGRLAALQFGARWHDNSDLYRPLMIAHAYRIALRARCGVAAQERYDDFLGSGVDEYWVNALVLMTLAMHGGNVTLPASGRSIHVAASFISAKRRSRKRLLPARREHRHGFRLRTSPSETVSLTAASAAWVAAQHSQH